MSPATPRCSSFRLSRIGAVGTVLAASAALAVAGTPAASAESLTLSSATAFSVQYRGNGHGHGLSQYGARGAAQAGLTYQQILAFYYPGTKLVATKSRLIRVRLSGTGSTLTVAAASKTTLTGVKGYLPTKGVARYRLIAGAGTTVTLQRLGTAKGSVYKTVRTKLPNRAEFFRAGGAPLRVYMSDHQSTSFNGRLRAVRSGAHVYVVNRLSLDRYTAAVAPREMPATWETAAFRAQSVAARTYGKYAVDHPSNSEYDICDTTQCQVYGGYAHYDTDGTLLWTGNPAVARATSNRVLEYRGATAFTQFSASNGGWTVAGGQPYMVAKADPYDTAASGDPYLNKTKKVTVAALAKYFGLATVSTIALSTRDGHGAWGGRVLTGYVAGTNKTGKAVSVPVDGFDLQAFFGLGTTWYRVLPAAPTAS
jgi:peptidoglycan hydrolase-like amidase